MSQPHLSRGEGSGWGQVRDRDRPMLPLMQMVPLRDTRLQYFISYAMLGSILPYASVFFRATGLSNAQVGYLFSIYSLASVLSPVLVTRVADGRGLDPRRLLAGTSAVAAAALLMLTWARGSVAVFSI